MNEKKINKNDDSIKILVAPLDWGLGHATRCIPIIQALLKKNIKVILAAHGPVATLLKKDFPLLTILPLKGYRITYSQNKKWFFAKIIMQLPTLVSAISYEKKWLKTVVKELQVDAVISDNRFGLHHAGITCIYITHQLFIATGNSFLNKIAQQINYRFINRYNECWVPDAEGEINLAGKLSHPVSKPLVPVKYLGNLSRFKKERLRHENDLLIILSGPEPQRTIFENILLKQTKNINLSIVLVRGLPGETAQLKAPDKKLQVYNHLAATELSKIIQQSNLILARAGYSTIMDLVALEKKAVLVPTPGQTEQEYLAKYLMDKKLFFAADQEGFLLKDVVEKVAAFKFAPVTPMQSNIEKNINDLIDRLKIRALK